MTSNQPTDDASSNGQPSAGAMTSKEKFDTLIGFLQTLVSWPVMIFIIIFLLRDQIPKMGERITSIGPSGIELAHVVATQEVVATQQVQAVATQETLKQEIDQIRQDLGLEFVPSSALNPEIQAKLEASIADYKAYLDTVGFNTPSEPVGLQVDIGAGDDAFYNPAENRIRLGPTIADDPEVAMYSYTEHMLFTALGVEDATSLGNVDRAVWQSLAAYFTCSFSRDPQVGKESTRNLEHERTMADIPPSQRNTVVLVRQIWDGAFWDLRSLLSPERADPILFAAWSETDRPIPSPSIFVEQIVTAAANDGGPDMSAEIRELFERRGLTVTMVVTPVASGG